MAIFNKNWLEYVAKSPKDKPYMSMEEFIESRMRNSEPLQVKRVKDDLLNEYVSELLPLGKISFHQYVNSNDELRLLTKNRYRRPHDYDMWIDLDKRVIYVENGKNNGYFKSEIDGIYQALGEKYGCPFDIKFSIPRNEFNLKME